MVVCCLNKSGNRPTSSYLFPSLRCITELFLSQLRSIYACFPFCAFLFQPSLAEFGERPNSCSFHCPSCTLCFIFQISRPPEFAIERIHSILITHPLYACHWFCQIHARQIRRAIHPAVSFAFPLHLCFVAPSFAPQIW